MLRNGTWFSTVGPINNLLFEKPYCGGMVIIVTFQNVVDQILAATLAKHMSMLTLHAT